MILHKQLLFDIDIISDVDCWDISIYIFIEQEHKFMLLINEL